MAGITDLMKSMYEEWDEFANVWTDDARTGKTTDPLGGAVEIINPELVGSNSNLSMPFKKSPSTDTQDSCSCSSNRKRKRPRKENMATDSTAPFYTYVTDSSVHQPNSTLAPVDLDDPLTQRVLHTALAHATLFPRDHMTEHFATSECHIIRKRVQQKIKGAPPNITNDEVEHILLVTYERFKSYCSLMKYMIPGVNEKLKFNKETGEVAAIREKFDGHIARSFYVNHKSVITNFVLLRTLFRSTWDKYFEVENVAAARGAKRVSSKRISR